MICFQCKKNFLNNGILISMDGDFVCSAKCKIKYEKEKEYFYKNIINSEKKFIKWISGDKNLWD